jgi:hypothetical protein
LIAAISDALETPSLTQFTIILSSGRIPAASLFVLASIALPAPHATSLLKRAGASDVVAREIVGYETAAVSRTYSHIDMAND